MEVAVVDKNDDFEVGNEDRKVKPLETKVAETCLRASPV